MAPDLTTYAAASSVYDSALTSRARAASHLGVDDASKAESLELLRAQLHLQIDRAIDEEALKLPDPTRIIFRASRYRWEE